MAASCSFFKLPYVDKNKQFDQEIVLEDVDGRVLKSIIAYCYTGRIQITMHNVDKIVCAALRMEIGTVIQKCQSLWLESVTTENCVRNYLAAEKYCFPKLRQKAVQTMIANLEKIPVNDMPKLDGGTLRELFNHGCLDNNEQFFFNCLVKWMQQVEIDQSDIAAQLFRNIKLHQFSGQVSRVAQIKHIIYVR